MTLAEVTASHQYAIGTHLEGLEDVMGGNPPAAHDPNGEDIGGIFPPAYPCLVCTCIATPGTEEAYDDGFELVFWNHSLTMKDLSLISGCDNLLKGYVLFY